MYSLSYRRGEDVELEYEITKCLKAICSNEVRSFSLAPFSTFERTFFLQPGNQDVLEHSQVLTQIVATLNTPNIATKKLILDLLIYYLYFSHGDVLGLIIQGLENLTNENHERGNCYTYWFKSLEQTLSGRGRMGTTVGASEEMKRFGQLDGSLSEFTVRCLVLSHFKYGVD